MAAVLESFNVARYLPEQAQLQPAGLAVASYSDDDPSGFRRTTFEELDQLSSAAAVQFREKGIRPGSRVLVMVRPGLELIVCAFALFRMGAVPVLIDPGMGLASFLNCVRRTRPVALVGIPLAHWVARLARKTFRHTAVRIAVGRNFIAGKRLKIPFDNSVIYSQKEDLAAILFTSGSTGPPKGVLYQHGQFEGQVHLIRETFGIQPGEVDLPMLPIFALFNPALGMATVVPDMNPSKPAAVDPEKIIHPLNTMNVTNSFGSPVLWKKITRVASAKGLVFSGMRRILMAGAPVPPSLFREMRNIFPNARLWSPYGATECLPVSAIEATSVLGETGQASECGAGTCVGPPVSGVRIQILKSFSGPNERMDAIEKLPVGEVGEIVVTGPTVTSGYDQLPDATLRSKLRDGEGNLWHRMGDHGYLDESGRLWFCGRQAERVKTPDGRVYDTDRVEGIMNCESGVRRSALIGWSGTAAVVIEPEDWSRKPSLRSLRERASRYEISRGIRNFFFERSFPVDVRHNAKIHRLQLARKFARQRPYSERSN